jgi:hypothetical protein
VVEEVERDEDQRCEDQRAADDPTPRRRIDLPDLTSSLPLARILGAVAARARPARFLELGRVDLDLATLLVDVDELVLVPALLLPAAALLP